jgi:hypothetical protein
LEKNTLAGQSLTAAASGTELLGNYLVDPTPKLIAGAGAGIGSAAEYVSGVNLFDGGPVPTPAAEATAAQPAASQGQVAEAQPQAFSLPAVEIATPVVQSPNTQTRESVTATGIGRLGLDPSVTGNGVGMVNPLTGEPLPFIQGVNGTMNQQVSLPEGLTASSPIPEGPVKAIGSDGRMILTSPAEAARLNAIESQTQKDDRAAQQKFLASDKAREFSNRQIRSSIMGDGQYGRDSLAREARQAARPDFGEAQTRAAGTVTDRDRRAARGEGISDADRRDIAKANMRDASAGDVARGMKVADLNGLDLRTGQPVKTDKPMTEKEQLQVEEQKKRNELLDQQIATGRNPEATPSEKKKGDRAAAVKEGLVTQAQADEANKQDILGKPPSGYDTWADYESSTGIDADGDGKVATKSDAAQATETKSFASVEEAEAANLPKGTKITINGRTATVQ